VRRKDNEGKSANNDAALEAMAKILLDGNAFCIFPEGISHNSTEVLELRAGFARACMIALEKNDSLQISIVPVGLNYEAKNRFQSDIFVEFGEPLVVTKQHLQLHQMDSQKTLSDLATNLKEGLEDVIIHAPNKEVLTVAHLARMMYREDSIQVTQREYVDFTKMLIDVFQEDNKESKDLFQALLIFQTHLDILGLR
jgi:glycerol-3-phosphate O-acyltransferase/dihydroxyacetone phosphate acyltransferase